jgi:hypothetical protein
LEFIPTAWELIPYSFVADYFANIGTILNSIPGLASDWVYVSKSARSVIHKKWATRFTSVFSQWRSLYWQSDYKPGELEITHFQRTKPVLTLPTFQVEIPVELTKWVNLGAISLGKLKPR